jgi:glycerophosphoryl diester phosphodiesterase
MAYTGYVRLMNRFDVGWSWVSLLSASVLALAGGCGGESAVNDPRPANAVVRERIASRGPAANLGHRGTGINRPGHALPENSIPSYVAALSAGADGVELDVELTADGQLIIMHDDTLDRTTTCTGCVSALTFDEARLCRLVNGDGEITDERPPTLAEVYAALPADALVDIELKVYDPPCLTPDTGAVVLAQRTVDAVHGLGVALRTLFSSFSEDAAAAVKEEDPTLYSAQLLLGLRGNSIERALERHLDAIHPLLLVPPATVQAILEAGLQANVWTVDTAAEMNAAIDKGATAIITDEPGLLAEVLAARR